MGRRKHDLTGVFKNGFTCLEDCGDYLVVKDTENNITNVKRGRFISGTLSTSIRLSTFMYINVRRNESHVEQLRVEDWWKGCASADEICLYITRSDQVVIYHPHDVVTQDRVTRALANPDTADKNALVEVFSKAWSKANQARLANARVAEAEAERRAAAASKAIADAAAEAHAQAIKTAKAAKTVNGQGIPHIPKGFKFFTITPEDIPDPDAPVELTEQTQGVWTAGDLNGDIATPEMLAQGVEELKKQVEQLTQKAITDPEAAAKEVERLAQEAKDFLNDPDGADTPSLLAPLLPVPVLTEKEKEEQAWLQQMNEESKIIAQQNLQRQAEEKRLRTPDLRI